MTARRLSWHIVKNYCIETDISFYYCCKKAILHSYKFEYKGTN